MCKISAAAGCSADPSGRSISQIGGEILLEAAALRGLERALRRQRLLYLGLELAPARRVTRRVQPLLLVGARHAQHQRGEALIGWAQFAQQARWRRLLHVLELGLLLLERCTVGPLRMAGVE